MSDVALFLHPDCLAHETGRHPENPGRLIAIWNALQGVSLPPAVSWQSLAMASEEQIGRVHSNSHRELIRDLAGRGGGMIGLDTVVSRRSYEAAQLAAGGAIAAARWVSQHPGARAFALVRPPGHHATPDEAMGFCLFNNVAIAARAAQVEFALPRIAIVDFDVHHGNGTQDAFYADADVLFCSLHQSPLYPGTGLLGEIGSGAGRGYTVNLPLPPGCGDPAYTRAFEQIVVPAVRRFRPDLILVSAGFDAHWADPLADTRVSTSGFVAMTRALADLADELCGGRLALTLEGGYNLHALSSSVVAVTTALAGGMPRDELGPYPGPLVEDIEAILERARVLHGL